MLVGSQKSQIAYSPKASRGVPIYENHYRYEVAGRRTRLRLLRDGLPATGRLIDKTRINVRTNSRRVYRMTFEYTCDHTYEQAGAVGRSGRRT